MFSSYMVFMLHIYTCRLPKEYNFHIHLTPASTAAAAKSSAPSSAAWAEPSSAAAGVLESAASTSATAASSTIPSASTHLLRLGD